MADNFDAKDLLGDFQAVVDEAKQTLKQSMQEYTEAAIGEIKKSDKEIKRAAKDLETVEVTPGVTMVVDKKKSKVDKKTISKVATGLAQELTEQVEQQVETNISAKPFKFKSLLKIDFSSLKIDADVGELKKELDKIYSSTSFENLRPQALQKFVAYYTSYLAKGGEIIEQYQSEYSQLMSQGITGHYDEVDGSSTALKHQIELYQHIAQEIERIIGLKKEAAQTPMFEDSKEQKRTMAKVEESQSSQSGQSSVLLDDDATEETKLQLKDVIELVKEYRALLSKKNPEDSELLRMKEILDTLDSGKIMTGIADIIRLPNLDDTVEDLEHIEQISERIYKIYSSPGRDVPGTNQKPVLSSTNTKPLEEVEQAAQEATIAVTDLRNELITLLKGNYSSTDISSLLGLNTDLVNRKVIDMSFGGATPEQMADEFMRVYEIINKSSNNSAQERQEDEKRVQEEISETVKMLKQQKENSQAPVRPGGAIRGYNAPSVLSTEYYQGAVHSIEDISEDLRKQGVPESEISQKAAEIRQAEIELIGDVTENCIRLIHRTSSDAIESISQTGLKNRYSTLTSTTTAINDRIDPNTDYGTHRGFGSFAVFDVPNDLYNYWERGIETQQEVQVEIQETEQAVNEFAQSEKQASEEAQKLANTIAEEFGVKSKTTIQKLGIEIDGVLAKLREANSTNMSDDEFDFFMSAPPNYHSILDVLASDAEVARAAIGDTYDSYDKLRAYVSKSTIKNNPDFKSEFGDDWHNVRNTIGSTVIKNGQGSDIMIFLEELNRTLGTTFDISGNAADGIRQLYEALEKGKQEKLALVSSVLGDNGSLDHIQSIIEANNQEIESNEAVVASEEKKRKYKAASRADVPKLAQQEASEVVDANQDVIQSNNDVIESEEKKKQRYKIASRENVPKLAQQSAKDSSSAVQEEAEAAKEVSDAMEKASKSKKKFAKANTEVKKSAEVSSDALDEEAESAKEVDEALDTSGWDKVTQRKTDYGTDPYSVTRQKTVAGSDAYKTTTEHHVQNEEGKTVLGRVEVKQDFKKAAEETEKLNKQLADHQIQIEAVEKKYNAWGIASEVIADKIAELNAEHEKVDRVKDSDSIDARKKAEEAFQEVLEQTNSQLKEIENTNKQLNKYSKKYDIIDPGSVQDLKSDISALNQQFLQSELSVDKYNTAVEEVFAKFEKSRAMLNGVQIGRVFDLDSAKQKVEDYANAIGKMTKDVQHSQNDKTGVHTFTTEVKDAQGEVQKLAFLWQESTGEMAVSTKRLRNELSGLPGILQTLGKKIKQLAVYWTANMLSPMDLLRHARSWFNYAKEYDDALTSMMKVSKDSIGVLQDFQKESFELADAVGTTASQLQNSVTDFLRLGETLEEAKKSGQEANILFNVSEFSSIDDATSSLISMSQAYDELEKMDIIDKLNIVGNNYAISTNELAQALQNSASALKVAGNDIDEAIALATTANTVVQDYSKVSAGIRTVSMRITGATAEELQEAGEDTNGLIETTAKLEEQVRSLTAVGGEAGVSLLDINGNFRSTYEILLDIAEVWDKIAEQDALDGNNRQNVLLESLAGKNRASILAAILDNPDILKSVYETSSQDSADSAQEELQKQLDSISGHIARLQNQWQNLWAETANRDVINFFLDLATSILKIADEIGVVKVLLFGGGGIFAAIKSIKGEGRPKCSVSY